MAMIPWYNPRDNTIAELLMRQGDIQARSQQQRGMLWANAINQVGQIGAQAYERHQEEKDQKKREQIIEAGLASWDGKDPMGLYRAWAPALGPEAAMKATTGMLAIAKAQQGIKPDPKEVVGGLAAFEQKTPGWIVKNWATTGPVLAPVAQMWGMPFDPAEPPADFGEQILALDAKLNATQEEGALIEEVRPDGQMVKRRATAAELRVGVPVAPKAENAPAVGSAEDYILRTYGPKPTPEQILEGRRRYSQADDKPRDPLAAALAQSRLDDQRRKAEERQAEIDAYTNTLERGDATIDTVPAPIRRDVMVAAEKRGLDVRTAKQKDLDAGAEQSIESLRQLREQAQRTMTATTGPGAVIQGNIQRGLNVVGLADETRKWEKQAAKLSLLARQLGEKGVLTDRDVERVVNMLPGLTDKAEIRDKALQDIEDIIFTGLRGRVSGRVKVPAAGGQTAQTVGRFKVEVQ